MKIKIVLLIAVSIFTVSKSRAQVPDWFQKVMQIKPFESSKADVERIFNDAKISKSFTDIGLEFVYYDVADGRLSLRYSLGKCSEISDAVFDLEKGRVVRVHFTPDNVFVKLFKYKIDVKRFDAEYENDNPTLHYFDDESGISYSTQRKKLKGVQLYAPQKYLGLKCRETLPDGILRNM